MAGILLKACGTANDTHEMTGYPARTTQHAYIVEGGLVNVGALQRFERDREAIQLRTTHSHIGFAEFDPATVNNNSVERVVFIPQPVQERQSEHISCGESAARADQTAGTYS